MPDRLRVIILALIVVSIGMVGARDTPTYAAVSPTLAAIHAAGDAVNEPLPAWPAVLWVAAQWAGRGVAAGFGAKFGADLYQHLHDWAHPHAQFENLERGVGRSATLLVPAGVPESIFD